MDPGATHPTGVALAAISTRQRALSTWFEERTAGSRGRMRKVMVVALARKLLIALWRFAETGLVPTGAQLV